MEPVPIVDYLVLDDGAPHLVAHRCTACGAMFLERRNACPSCSGQQFERQRLSDRGCIESFTVVVRGAPKRTGPFISALVRLDDGAYVKANLVGVAPDADAVDLSLPVHLRTFSLGTDDDGTEAIGFGFGYEGAAVS